VLNNLPLITKDNSDVLEAVEVDTCASYMALNSTFDYVPEIDPIAKTYRLPVRYD
jgi:hypothetical protein